MLNSSVGSVGRQVLLYASPALDMAAVVEVRLGETEFKVPLRLPKCHDI